MRLLPTMFWGKLDVRDDDDARAHPLVDHAIDVAMVFRALVDVPIIRRRLSASSESIVGVGELDRLAVIAFLHDIGKCNWGFQAKRDPAARETAGHVIEALAIFDDSAVMARWPVPWRSLLETAAGWFENTEDDLFAMLLAAISHHGRPVCWNDGRGASDRNLGRWWRARGSLDPMVGLAELAETARRVFPKAFAESVAPVRVPAAFQQRFAGLVMLADWIGSDTRFFPYRDDEAQDRTLFAADASRRALAAIGLAPPDQRSPRSFRDVFPQFPPSPLQQAVADTLPTGPDARLVLVESDTGSGKTEAALGWFLRLYAEGCVDGLYFALPTRVAARELYGRVCRAIDSAFPDPETRPGPALLAAPGYVLIDGVQPVLPDPAGRLWEDDATMRWQERQWAAAHPKRFLAAPIAVGTIDQALLAALMVKHSLLRSVCLDRSLLVVDEVHASDAYMRQLLIGLLQGHLGRGGHALLLSATLGESACSAFFDRAPLALADAERRPYPSITTRAREHPIAASGMGKRVRFEFVETLEDSPVVDALVDALDAGARVLVICNTVARANGLLRAVEADGRIARSSLFEVGEVACPHHGRFAREHRQIMDEQVSRRLGRDSPVGPVLLIGTQTLEQSLDIDADWLISDPCPMDVLLQRVGRLHRHRRAVRPAGFESGRILLRVPPTFDLLPFLRADGALRGPAGIGRVYEDGRVLQRTLHLLREQPCIDIPTDNRRLIEQTTHPEALRVLEGRWQRHEAEVIGRDLMQVRAAVTNALADKPFGELHYPAPDEQIVTRLGAANLNVSLAHPMSHPFGTLIHSVGIPAHMAPSTALLPEQIEATTCDDGFRFTLGDRRFRYTRYGLEIDDDA